MFVPCTPRGELVKMMREVDKRFREGTDIKKIKFIERRGRSLQDILVSGNPWSDIKCGREKCVICQRETGSMGECTRENALYKITCKECKKEEKVSEYWGETGRNCFLRGGEHWKGLEDKEEENALWKHAWERHHGESDPNMFEMKLEGTFKKPLQRQIREGVELEMSRAGTILNSKSEWNHSKIPRIVIESGDQQTTDSESGMGKVTTKKRAGEEISKRKVKRYEAEKRGRGEEMNPNPSKRANREEI